MRLAILGRTGWLLAAARRLQAAGHEIAFVATAEAPPEYTAAPTDFRELAKSVDAPFITDPDINAPQTLAVLREARADIAVSVNWPRLIRAEACAAFPRGILNAHAGDLPRYRGNACPNWSIINNEDNVGLCVHAMDPNAVDAGPIYARDRFALSDQTYIGDVYAWLDEAVPALFVTAVERAVDPDFIPEDQALSPLRPLRAHPRRPEDGLIDWSASAEAICRLVRASSRPFAGAFSHLEGSRRVTIWRARIARLEYDLAAVPGQIMGRGPDGGVLVACGTGALELEDAQMDDGSALPAANRYRLTRP